MIALSGGDAGPQGACVSCHGIDGRGNGGAVPRLAGIGVGYLNRQMDNFAAGLRQHPQMQATAKRLNGAERQKVSLYYAQMPMVLPPVARAAVAPALYSVGSPSRGLPACASCHGADGEGSGQGNPPLAGQPAAYLAGQLYRWQQGKRRGDPGNVMLAISRRLTSTEIALLSSYASGLPGGALRPQRPAASPPGHRRGATDDAPAPRLRGAE